MADNITEAFQALHARIDHVLAMRQQDFWRGAVSLEAPEIRRAVFQDAVRDIGRTTDWLAAHPLDQVQAEQARLYDKAVNTLWGRTVGEDGPDDVRISREDGPPSGSLAAVQAELTLEDHVAREAERESPDEMASLQREVQAMRARLDGLEDQTQDASHQKDQGMGYA